MVSRGRLRGREAEVLARQLEKMGYVRPAIVEDMPPAQSERQAHASVQGLENGFRANANSAASPTASFRFPNTYEATIIHPQPPLVAEAVSFEEAGRAAAAPLAEVRRLSKEKKTTEALEVLETSFQTLPESARAHALMELGRLRARAGL